MKQIRHMKPADIEAVMQIWLCAAKSGHPFIPAEYWENSFYGVQHTYLPSATTYVFVQDDMVCGFVSVMGVNHIGALFVGDACRRQGVGTALISYLKHRYETLTLCVYQKNTDAVRFYKVCGFEIIGENVNAGTGEAEYTMQYVKN